MNLIFDSLLPVWLVVITILYIVGMLAFGLSEGSVFELDMSAGTNSMSSTAKIRATRFFVRDIPLWPLTAPVYIWKLLRFLRKKYSGWKIEANQEAVADLQSKLYALQEAIDKRTRLQQAAEKERQKFLDLQKSQP